MLYYILLYLLRGSNILQFSL